MLGSWTGSIVGDETDAERRQLQAARVVFPNVCRGTTTLRPNSEQHGRVVHIHAAHPDVEHQGAALMIAMTICLPPRGLSFLGMHAHARLQAMLRTPVPWACTRRMATRSRAAAGACVRQAHHELESQAHASTPMTRRTFRRSRGTRRSCPQGSALLYCCMSSSRAQTRPITNLAAWLSWPFVQADQRCPYRRYTPRPATQRSWRSSNTNRRRRGRLRPRQPRR